ncbi:MAG: diguanylate cyclase [Gemmataceae bacterium]
MTDWQAKHLDSLLRASRSVVQMDSPEQLLQSVLDDMVMTLDAQQGAILLWDEKSQDIQLRATSSRRPRQRRQKPYSETLVREALQSGEPQLWIDLTMNENVHSVKAGSMTSVVCALLQTPHRCLGVVHLDRGPLQEPFTLEELNLARGISATISGAIESAQLVVQQREQLWHTMNLLCQTIELRDTYTGGHAQRVTEYAVALAKGLELSASDIHQIQMGGPLHDIGKIGILDSVLRKPGKLTDDEFDLMRMHPLHGADILETIPALRLFAPIARSHHERWDGKGYPDKLAGEEIPFLARVVAVADTFDAMTSDRPYRKGLSIEAAFDEIRKQAGKQFDPQCAKAFLAQRKTIEKLHAKLTRSKEPTPELVVVSDSQPNAASVEKSSPPLTQAYQETIKATLTPRTVEQRHKGCLVQIYPTGPGLGTRTSLPKKVFTIGRSIECDLCVEDTAVSRQHLRINLTPQGFVVTDLNSTNGTFVNTEPVTTHALQDGDYLQVGNRIFRFLSGGNMENEYYEEIYRLTIMDGLTNTYNKRYLLETLDRELLRSVHYRRSISLLMLDIDRFKVINDDLGHLAGDTILRELARRLSSNLRSTEICARYGGEEFAILLPEVTPEVAAHVAERLRKAIECEPFYYEERDIQVTVSVGIATTQGNDASLTPLEFIRMADEKLYQAKKAGRNRVTR